MPVDLASILWRITETLGLRLAVGATVYETEDPVAAAVRVHKAPGYDAARHRPALQARAHGRSHHHYMLHYACQWKPTLYFVHVWLTIADGNSIRLLITMPSTVPGSSPAYAGLYALSWSGRMLHVHDLQASLGARILKKPTEVPT